MGIFGETAGEDYDLEAVLKACKKDAEDMKKLSPTEAVNRYGDFMIIESEANNG